MKFRVTRWAGRAVTICQRCASRSEPELLDRRIDLWQREHVCGRQGRDTDSRPVSSPLAGAEPSQPPTDTPTRESA